MGDSEKRAADSSDDFIAKKQAKLTGRAQVFINKYSDEFPCTKRSKRGDGFALCTVCSCDFSIAHGGRNDIAKHDWCVTIFFCKILFLVVKNTIFSILG